MSELPTANLSTRYITRGTFSTVQQPPESQIEIRLQDFCSLLYWIWYRKPEIVEHLKTFLDYQ